MNLEEISHEIKHCAVHMNARYGSTVFDEWAVLLLAENKARLLFYTGPRQDHFLSSFGHDLGSLRSALLDDAHAAGDFEFSRQGINTSIDAFLVVGQGLYLICNNTRESVDDLAKKARWIMAQAPFVELAEKIRANPLEIAWDTSERLKVEGGF